MMPIKTGDFIPVFTWNFPVLIMITTQLLASFRPFLNQARNQEFFRAGEVSENKGTSVNI